ncbi:D-arabinose 5-phosphate isomerase [hydrothermal vent metagenome]|uniref:D-arabinose 5-phosphate isomerase n=1 Tax=hydrothermal vent metagenome TaxID=652676 RepID=A0A3B0ZQG8_9ZZZZ
MKEHKFKELGLAVVQTEMSAIAALAERIDESFVTACQLMLACEGRIVVIGMGKSGHIGSKVAATLASTGTPAFFVHPGEASHGDLGMITAKDTVLALSNSGETEEILVILPIIKRLGIPLISLTGSPTSSLAKGATVHIDVSVAQEACPLGLAPTASTTACLVMGDALAVALLEGRGFTADDFARSHPGGRLGRRLLLLISDVMATGEAIPAVVRNATLSAGLLEMSKKGLGMTAVIDDHSHVIGIFTDGDLRRKLDQGIDVHAAIMGDVMTPGLKTIKSNILAAEALQVMESRKINGLLVVNEQGKLEGAVNMHHLLKAGVV